jgi:hypothetical protein
MIMDLQRMLQIMNKVEKKLNDVLGIDASYDVVETNKDIIPSEKKDEIVIKENYNNTINTLNNLIEVGEDSIATLLSVAKETEHPRAFEVVGQLLKVTGNLSKDLIELQMDMKRQGIKNKKEIVNNNVFVGNTAEFLSLIKDKKKDIDGDL